MIRFDHIKEKMDHGVGLDKIIQEIVEIERIDVGVLPDLDDVKDLVIGVVGEDCHLHGSIRGVIMKIFHISKVLDHFTLIVRLRV